MVPSALSTTVPAGITKYSVGPAGNGSSLMKTLSPVKPARLTAVREMLPAVSTTPPSATKKPEPAGTTCKVAPSGTCSVMVVVSLPEIGTVLAQSPATS